MVVSRQEVLSHRQEMVEDIVAKLVPDIDKLLLKAKTFPVVYEITSRREEHPSLGNALRELYEQVGWIVRSSVDRESAESYGDQRGEVHHYVCFYLVDPEITRGWDDR